eukprot:m.294683 g.294683  ORF g.294683 m.294683 type:complete len:91 (+) comp19506_c0_seq3:1038-1310(+)
MFLPTQDKHNVRTIAFHPAGKHLVAGTDHPLLRLYSVQTMAVFTAPNPADNHMAPINSVRKSGWNVVHRSITKAPPKRHQTSREAMLGFI